MDKWIGQAVSRMHMAKISNNSLAKHLGYTPEYVCVVLNGKRSPKNAEKTFMRGINELIEMQKKIV